MIPEAMNMTDPVKNVLSLWKSEYEKSFEDMVKYIFEEGYTAGHGGGFERGYMLGHEKGSQIKWKT